MHDGIRRANLAKDEMKFTQGENYELNSLKTMRRQTRKKNKKGKLQIISKGRVWIIMKFFWELEKNIRMYIMILSPNLI